MLTPRQKEGADKIKAWFNNQDKQIFTLAGYAGTGKSFMTELVIQELGLKYQEVAYCTFTGKASLVLTKYHKGKSQVSTIHKLIYDVRENRTGETEFVLKESLPDIRLIVVDEASMVSGSILADLMSFNKPILAIGDHGQLPPVGEEVNLMNIPDFKLTEILRQAENNPIIWLSKLVREGKTLEHGMYDNKVLVMSKQDNRANPGVMLHTDQVICGYNKTRVRLNNQIRQKLGYTVEHPDKGDKVIFLKNNWDKAVDGYNLVNGMIGYIEKEPVEDQLRVGLDTYKMDIRPDFLENSFKDIHVPQADFNPKQKKVGKYQEKLIDRIDYGYAVTCHKAQGSQFDRVFVWNEPLGEEKWRWTYTAITRASDRLILAL